MCEVKVVFKDILYFEICSSTENSRSGAPQDDDPRVGVKANSFNRLDQLEDKIFTE